MIPLNRPRYNAADFLFHLLDVLAVHNAVKAGHITPEEGDRMRDMLVNDFLNADPLTERDMLDRLGYVHIR